MRHQALVESVSHIMNTLLSHIMNTAVHLDIVPFVPSTENVQKKEQLVNGGSSLHNKEYRSFSVLSFFYNRRPTETSPLPAVSW